MATRGRWCLVGLLLASVLNNSVSLRVLRGTETAINDDDPAENSHCKPSQVNAGAAPDHADFFSTDYTGISKPGLLDCTPPVPHFNLSVAS
jgi:hypothetical protein